MIDNLMIADQFIYGSTENSNLRILSMTPDENIYIWRVRFSDGVLSDDAADIQVVLVEATGS